MVNACVSGTAVLIKNTTDYLDNYSHAASFAGAVATGTSTSAGTDLGVTGTCPVPFSSIPLQAKTTDNPRSSNAVSHIGPSSLFLVIPSFNIL